MTSEDRARLRALAEKMRSDVGEETCFIAMSLSGRNYIAASRAEVIIILLDELDRKDAALLSAEADGRRKGREAMREEAAAAMDKRYVAGGGAAEGSALDAYNRIYSSAAAVIRSLPLEAPQDKREPG